ncbi:MAG TPA: NAD(+)/NADH kinase [Gaiellaceae bacterium]|nr:NAD(+)/NADH kinase [Gaiellaceae bacterium]
MRPVERAAVVVHGTRDVSDASARLEAVAREAGVELVSADGSDVDIAVVLGGDGTLLRALARFLGTGVPAIGVNFGRVGFLTAMTGDQLERGLARVFAGDYRVLELPTLEVTVDAARYVAVNDAVVASGTLGRMMELGYAIGGEDLGVQPCDGVICATPSGSTAYNLSNGGPVLVWGLDAMVITFAAPHTLHARPLVVGRESDLEVTNRTPAVAAVVLIDGHPVAELQPGDGVHVHLAEQRSLLATLPERGFFQRYADAFGAR